MNFFPMDPILWAGLGNNPPSSSPYWKEEQAIRYARIIARQAPTWGVYCLKFEKSLKFFLRIYKRG